MHKTHCLSVSWLRHWHKPFNCSITESVKKLNGWNGALKAVVENFKINNTDSLGNVSVKLILECNTPNVS